MSDSPRMPSSGDTAVDRVVAAAIVMHDAGGPVSLGELAASLGCSERQVSRSFREVLGVTPRDYGEAVRTDSVRAVLREHGSVSDALYASGYGSSRAFYEEAGQRLGMPPREYAAGGRGRPLVHASVPVTMGLHERVIVAVASSEGLCAVRIGVDEPVMLEEVRRELPHASLTPDTGSLDPIMRALAALAIGGPAEREIPLDVRGTAFQARVWEALVRIPSGETRTYADVADEIGRPTAVRAVARACATNPVALVVPCHRVVRTDGSLSGYRWGLELKAALLTAEGQPGAVTGTMVG